MYTEESDQYLSSDSLSDVEKDLRSPFNGWEEPSETEAGNDDANALLRKARRRIVASSDEEDEDSDDQSDNSLQESIESPQPNNGHTSSKHSEDVEYLDPDLYCLRRSGRTNSRSKIPKVSLNAMVTPCQQMVSFCLHYTDLHMSFLAIWKKTIVC
jgi:hypothetical protein